MTDVAPYLVVLYAAERKRDGPIPPGHVATKLDRSPSSTTEMLQRLEERGLVSREPYDGATLTPEGRAIAEPVFETYRTLLVFFRDVLELEDAEAEARQLAGSVSPLVAERLAATLLADEPSDSDFDAGDVPNDRRPSSSRP